MAFEKGTRALWIPGRPRNGAFGAAWGVQPVEVEIISGPNAKGAYKCKVLDVKLSAPKCGYSFILPTHLVTNYEVRK